MFQGRYTWRQGDTVAPPTVPWTLDTPVGGSTSTGAELLGQGDPPFPRRPRRRDAQPPADVFGSGFFNARERITLTGYPIHAAAFASPDGDGARNSGV